MTRGLVPDSLNDKCSNEAGVGMGTVVVLISCLCIIAIPPQFG